MNGEALEGLQSLGKAVGVEEGLQVLTQALMALVVIAPNRCALDGPVHSLNLSVGPGVVGPCQAMVDIVLGAGQYRTHGSGTVPSRRSVDGPRQLSSLINLFPSRVFKWIDSLGDDLVASTAATAKAGAAAGSYQAGAMGGGMIGLANRRAGIAIKTGRDR